MFDKFRFKTFGENLADKNFTYWAFKASIICVLVALFESSMISYAIYLMLINNEISPFYCLFLFPLIMIVFYFINAEFIKGKYDNDYYIDENKFRKYFLPILVRIFFSVVVVFIVKAATDIALQQPRIDAYNAKILSDSKSNVIAGIRESYEAEIRPIQATISVLNERMRRESESRPGQHYRTAQRERERERALLESREREMERKIKDIKDMSKETFIVEYKMEEKNRENPKISFLDFIYFEYVEDYFSFSLSSLAFIFTVIMMIFRPRSASIYYDSAIQLFYSGLLNNGNNVSGNNPIAIKEEYLKNLYNEDFPALVARKENAECDQKIKEQELDIEKKKLDIILDNRAQARAQGVDNLMISGIEKEIKQKQKSIKGLYKMIDNLNLEKDTADKYIRKADPFVTEEMQQNIRLKRKFSEIEAYYIKQEIKWEKDIRIGYNEEVAERNQEGRAQRTYREYKKEEYPISCFDNVMTDELALKTLNLEENFTNQELIKAYQGKSLGYDPKNNKEDISQERIVENGQNFQKIQKAYHHLRRQ